VSSRIRVGIGHDVHPLTNGKDLVIGGVHMPHPRGLDGHSDGDVLVHAVIDALLGAAGERDIGVWFPDTDVQYRGIESLTLLRQVGEALTARGWTVGNVDASVVAQRPRLAAHLDAMRANLAKAMNLETDCVNVKATSPEYIGALGREDGIAAFATALIERTSVQ
jgi:2-C-methyl-D-erythritol 2,4-cyclodiphosphate synthase